MTHCDYMTLRYLFLAPASHMHTLAIFCLQFAQGYHHTSSLSRSLTERTNARLPCYAIASLMMQ